MCLNKHVYCKFHVNHSFSSARVRARKILWTRIVLGPLCGRRRCNLIIVK
jgi:hypothetical protein